jgi:hypothetical protein
VGLRTLGPTDEVLRVKALAVVALISRRFAAWVAPSGHRLEISCHYRRIDDLRQRRYRDSECHQMLRFGSPVFEMASAIQARALALSAIRSAREGALSLSPPAAMYCCANLPSDRQFSELSYFTFRSRTSATQRLAAPLI